MCEGMRARFNPSLIRYAKIGLSLGLLLILLRAVSWDSISTAFLQSQPSWVLFSLIAAIVQIVVSAWRWQFLLRALGVRAPSLKALVYYYFVSGFFNNFAPANLAGDAVRVGSLYRDGRDGIALTSSVVLERLMNLAGLGLLCAWVFVARPLPITLGLKGWLIWGALGALICCGVACAWLWLRAPAWLSTWVVRVRELSSAVGGHYRELGNASLITPALLFIMMLITFGSLQAMSVHLALSIHLAVYAVAGLALSIPLTIQGVGVREGVYIGMLGIVGVEPARVLAALALNYMILLMLSLLGGVLFFVGPRVVHS